MVKRVSLWLLCVFAIVAMVATSGNLWAGTVLWEENFSVGSYNVAEWDQYVLAAGSNTWSSANENLFFDGNAGYGACTAVDAVKKSVLDPIEDVEVTCVVHMGTPDSNLYLGPIVRGTIISYSPYTELTGEGYGYTLSGYDGGGGHSEATGEVAVQYWAGTTGSALHTIYLEGDYFEDVDVYVKFSAFTTPEGNVQLDGMMSLSSDFSSPFGVINYLHTDEATKVVSPGQVGLVGANMNKTVSMSGTYDDLVISTYSPPGPGDANGDSFVDDTDASILGANWLKQSGATWAMGDFNKDGKVNDQDAAIMAANWAPAGGGSAVPEPGTLVLLVSAALALWFWRRR